MKSKQPGPVDHGGHYVRKCKHGIVQSQCRCMAASKAVEIVPCPPGCVDDASTAQSRETRRHELGLPGHNECASAFRDALHAAAGYFGTRQTLPAFAKSLAAALAGKPEQVAAEFRGAVRDVVAGLWAAKGKPVVVDDELRAAVLRVVAALVSRAQGESYLGVADTEAVAKIRHVLG